MWTFELLDISFARMFEWNFFLWKKRETLVSFLNFYLSQVIIFCYTKTVPWETFFKFDQVGMKHHYDNVWDSNLEFYSHVFF